jgi:Transposase DDE domain
MRRAQYTISGQDVSKWAVQCLLEALNWTSVVKGLGERLVQLLVRAAAEMRSFSAIAGQANLGVSLETIRQALLQALPGTVEELLPLTTRALQRRLPKALTRRPRTMIVDVHLRPYYGDPKTPGVFRGKPKAGTKYFFAYATLLVMRRGQTYTVGLTPIVNGQEQTTYLQRLIEQAAQAGLRVRRLLLDRGFYAANTIQWLQDQSISFVMPMIRRGKSGHTKATSTGTAVFFVKGRRGWTQHTWTARRRRGQRKDDVPTVTVDVCIAPRPEPSKRSRQRRGKKRRKRGPLVYVCHNIQRTPAKIVELYRKRFRIETSYRQLGEGLAATCSTNWVLRLLLVAIALVLRNLWIWLHWKFLAEPSPTGRRLQLQRLPFRQLTYWLIQTLNKNLEVRVVALSL